VDSSGVLTQFIEGNALPTPHGSSKPHTPQAMHVCIPQTNSMRACQLNLHRYTLYCAHNYIKNNRFQERILIRFPHRQTLLSCILSFSSCSWRYFRPTHTLAREHTHTHTHTHSHTHTHTHIQESKLQYTQPQRLGSSSILQHDVTSGATGLVWKPVTSSYEEQQRQLQKI
jgi:hypothetical protein